MIKRLFFDHPAMVGESYLEHLQTSAGFAGTMIVAGMACLVHAFVPGLFTKTGSAAIGRLHDHMVVHRTGPRHRAFELGKSNSTP